VNQSAGGEGIRAMRPAIAVYIYPPGGSRGGGGSPKSEGAEAARIPKIRSRHLGSGVRRPVGSAVTAGRDQPIGQSVSPIGSRSGQGQAFSTMEVAGELCGVGAKRGIVTALYNWKVLALASSLVAFFFFFSPFFLRLSRHVIMIAPSSKSFVMARTLHLQPSTVPDKRTR